MPSKPNHAKSPQKATSLAVALHQRAVKKLGPGNWQATDRSLQQATPWQVARLKASWFGSQMVYDLCCGIGGDACQLARRGPVVAVDSDANLIEIIRANLAIVESEHEVRAECADVSTIAIPAAASIHIDPDRRAGGSRTIRPNDYQPCWNQVSRLVANADASIIKLAPAARIATDSLPTHHRCWISLQGRVREQSVLAGQTLDASGLVGGRRSAVSIRADGSNSWYRPNSEKTKQIQMVDRPQRWLVDPDAAVRAAGLTEQFANEYGLSALDRVSGFLTGEQLCDDVKKIAVTGEVIWVGACDDRKLRRELRSRDVFPIAIKVRGTDHDPAVLTKRYRDCGDSPVTLWIMRNGKRVVAAMTQQPYCNAPS